MAKASGMGQHKGVSFISDEENPRESPKANQVEESKLLTTDNVTANQTVTNEVDFFQDRSYYKIFLETSKE